MWENAEKLPRSGHRAQQPAERTKGATYNAEASECEKEARRAHEVATGMKGELERASVRGRGPNSCGSCARSTQHSPKPNKAGSTGGTPIAVGTHRITPSYGNAVKEPKDANLTDMTMTTDRRAKQGKVPVEMMSKGGRRNQIIVVIIACGINLYCAMSLGKHTAATREKMMMLAKPTARDREQMNKMDTCRAVQVSSPARRRSRGRRTGMFITEPNVTSATCSFGIVLGQTAGVNMTRMGSRRVMLAEEQVQQGSDVISSGTRVIASIAACMIPSHGTALEATVNVIKEKTVRGSGIQEMEPVKQTATNGGREAPPGPHSTDDETTNMEKSDVYSLTNAAANPRLAGSSSANWRRRGSGRAGDGRQDEKGRKWKAAPRPRDVEPPRAAAEEAERMDLPPAAVAPTSQARTGTLEECVEPQSLRHICAEGVSMCTNIEMVIHVIVLF